MLTNDLNQVPAKNVKRVASYVPPDIYEALHAWAEADSRTVSNLIAVLLTRAVEDARKKEIIPQKPETNNPSPTE